MNRRDNLKTRVRMYYFQVSGDLLRFLSWNFGGGKRFYSKHWKDLVAGHKWIFVVGCNNSGTSLLQRMLGFSGNISTWPLEGQRYSRVMPRAMRRGYGRIWMEYANDLSMDQGSLDSKAPRLVHDWMESLGQPIKEIILEKTPANLLRMEWLQQVFPNSYFIGLVRNGYAVAEGIHRKSHKDIGQAARHWANANAAMLEAARSIDRFIEIRYEDFFENKQETARRIADFIGFDLEVLSFAMSQKFALKTVEGEYEQDLKNMNFSSFKRLTSHDVQAIEKNAKKMLDYFNYKPN